MSFTPKTWKDGRAGGTRQSAAAMIDLERRLSDYTDQRVGQYYIGMTDPATLGLPAGTVYRWDKVDGAGTLLDIITGVA